MKRIFTLIALLIIHCFANAKPITRQLFVYSFLIVSFFNHNLLAQSTNMGKDFWVAYGYHEYFETDNSQNMNLVLSVGDLPAGVTYATVTISIDSSKPIASLFWKRVYNIPANTVVSIDENSPYIASAQPAGTSGALNWGPIPKGTTNPNQANSPTSVNYDARLYENPIPIGNGGVGIFKGKAIHITSDVNIAVYSHIYGGASSGASMLLPTSLWGYTYTSINSAQSGYTSSDANYFFVIAKDDSTRIKITPSAKGKYGIAAGVPYYVDLHKGQVYQYIGYVNNTGPSFLGVELTGSTIESVPNAVGTVKKIAVFSGSGRTGGEQDCGGAGKDNDMQQCFPQNSWGKRYATIPFSNGGTGSITPGNFFTTIYKVTAKDTGTTITINGAAPIAIAANSTYKFANAIPNYIQSNKPIMVTQFMGGGCMSNDGDPEMIYLTPIENAITDARIYRTTREGIHINYVSIVVPDTAKVSIDTILVNGTNSSLNIYVGTHPNLPGYKFIVKGWVPLASQVLIKSNAPFTGITYGLGGAESYGYNLGAKFDSINYNYNLKGRVVSPLLKGITNVSFTAIGAVTVTQKTDTNGVYSCYLQEGGNTLRVRKNNDITKANGVTTADIVLVQRHILNLAKLNSPYKLIAADVNNDKTIGTADVIKIKRLVLGLDTTFTGNRLWAFVDSAYVFPDTTNPFPYKDSISFSNLSSNKTNQTFIGVKLGDVNYDWNASVARLSTANSLQLIADVKQENLYRVQNPIKVAITTNNFKQLNSFQYTLHFDNSKYELVNLEGFKNLQGLEWNATKANETGNIAMLWVNAKGSETSLEDGSLLFELILKPKEFGIENLELGLSLTNDITDIEAWDNNNRQHNIILIKKAKNQSVNNKDFFTVYPNPVYDVFTVNVSANSNKKITLELTDVQGNIILRKSLMLQKGNNNVDIHLTNRTQIISGMYFITAVGLDESNVQKIYLR